MTAEPASPCTGVCELDAAGRCRGCRRTLEEIAGWAAMTPAARRAVLAALAMREGPHDGD